MKTPKRSKELSKQDKDGNPIWLKPERSKESEDELDNILSDFYFHVTGIDDYGCPSCIAAKLAIEKWAKERYAQKNR